MCICDWPVGCGGSGILMCDGCGGDQCVCNCGGEMECYGCEECGDGLDYEDDYAAIEAEHLGSPEDRTGIYAPQPVTCPQ